MKNAARLLSSRIEQLLKFYSKEEVRLAVTMLNKETLDKFSSIYAPADKIVKSTGSKLFSTHKEKKGIDQTISRAVLNLESNDPEKFRILSEFDRNIRTGRILGSNQLIRRFGEGISKDFSPRKSRRESIGALMEVLSLKNVQEIINIIESSSSFVVNKDSDEYQRLAKFLIKGKNQE